jgi:hypothetical protein
MHSKITGAEISSQQEHIIEGERVLMVNRSRFTFAVHEEGKFSWYLKNNQCLVFKSLISTFIYL